MEMLDLWGAQVPHGWVTGDDELGRHTRFRQELRERGERYVLGVPCNTTMRDLEAPLPAYAGRGRRPKAPWQSVTALAPIARPGGMDPLDGARRGERPGGHRDGHTPGADAARAQTHGTRGVAGGHPAAPHGRRARWRPRLAGCHAIRTPAIATTTTSRRRMGPRWRSQSRRWRNWRGSSKRARALKPAFKRGKGEVGMDEYQVRTVRRESTV